MLEVLKRLLLKIVDDIDSGNSNLTENELSTIINKIKEFTDKTQRMSKYESCKYLNISRAKFDNLVKDNIIPKGKKTIGFKELSWDKKTLDEVITKIKH